MKNNNKTLKRLTATFLTATSIFNFTVPGKAKVVNFQSDGSIQYGKENGETISNKQLEEIMVKFKNQFDANINRLGREYHYEYDDYSTDNFTAKDCVNNTKSDDNEEYTDYRVDKEIFFEYNDIKNVYIIYSVDGSLEEWGKKIVENDKKEGSFNQFDPEHKDSIFLVIALDGEWEKMEEIYKKEDVQNKFIRFGRIVDTNETVNLTRKVGIPNTQETQTITSDVSVREIEFIDPTSPQQQQQQQQSNYNDNGNGNDTNKIPTPIKKSLLKPILIGGCGIFAACLISIPVIGPIIEQHIKNIKTKVNIKKINTNINTHTNK